MRVVRLLGVALTILITGLTTGVLLASPTGAQPPAKLTDHITDSSGVLADYKRAAVSSAIERLHRDRHIQLWVVYVDNFSNFKPDNWANQTRDATGMGDHDALLAVATKTKRYSFIAPPNLLSADGSNTLRSNRIEPAVAARDWSGAAVAAADGLDTPVAPAKQSWLPFAIGVVIAALVLVVLILLLYRARRRRRAARRIDPGDGHDPSLGQAVATAEARLRQISDYVARHGDSVGGQARARLDEARRQLAAAHGKQASNEQEAIAHAHGASTLAAQAQTLANDDVLAAHRTPRRRGTASKR
ncbi:hypothetical protein BST11_06700 [Mycobacterium alsense]|uniref:TPM domain-containing protein n=1 Tax=Mycobacterium alsense TaxID=324058 RepID=A0AA42BZI6_9MYCO|nr:TPM domain-containing protein [Mycobacterium alsense]MCV7380815.1 TPM domain-containing protein [Mycobacterium alsense]OQZ91866.1 hypothetical protein BST11_06700 [Mycobacterium alsense]